MHTSTYMRKGLWIILLALILCILSGTLWAIYTDSLVFRGDSLSLTILQPERITVDRPEALHFEVQENRLILTGTGKGWVDLFYEGMPLLHVWCGENGFLYEQNTDNYTGWEAAAGSLGAFLLITTLVMIIETILQFRTELYSYASPLYLSLSLILVNASINFLMALGTGSVFNIRNSITTLMQTMMVVLLPLLMLFTLSMVISNISLIRHEGSRWFNLLGSLIGMGFLLGVALLLFFSDFRGSEEEYRIHLAVESFLSAFVVFAECKLLSIIFCGVLAAKRTPKQDQDYILILGCQIRKNGTLTPLLRGRVDRALSFCRSQEQVVGRQAMLVPCGGKGKNEVRSEAGAMEEYLLSQGFPKDRIRLEDRSVNTYENMQNARKLIPEGANVAFATTNYHVFRGGIWARKCGLQADGMGSKTKWYYWPNAFMREYVALIMANLLSEIGMLVLIAFLSALSVLLLL